MTSTDKLANAGNEEIHGIHSFTTIVVVVSHVECLDALWIVVYEDSGIKLGFCQPSLVLGGKIGSKFSRDVPLQDLSSMFNGMVKK